jgi:uncharacterized protein DUF4271
VNSAYYQHIFAQHLLQKQHALPLLKAGTEQVWPSVFLIACLSLLALIKVGAHSKVVKIVQSTFSSQAMQLLEREEVNPFKFYHIALNLFFILNLSFLAYKINSIYNYILVEESRFTQFSFFLLIVVIVFAFKILMNNLLAFFTNERKVVSEYTVNSILVNETFGLLLFPWIVLSEFSTFNPLVFVSGALIILAASQLLKWYRGVIIGLVEERIGLLQTFSYFCGLEILPVLVLVKYIVETF